MVQVYTDLPTKHKGEKDLASQIIGADDPEMHLWFGLNYIPGVNDIDMLIWHERAGIFCIEVKAVPLKLVEEFGLKHCLITGRKKDDGPQNQAYRAMEALQRYTRPMGVDPFLISTACWPLISRRDWQRTWDNPAIAEDLSWRMIFSEDLETGSESLVERLSFIWKNPPVRGGSWNEFRHNPRQLLTLQGLLKGNANKKISETDLQKLEVIERQVKANTLREVPSTETTEALYTGYPGTGKTFRLLQIAAYHAFQGRKVLYCCYNKTLAADVRRILSNSKQLPMAEYALEVYDVFDMLRYYYFGSPLEKELSNKNSRVQNDYDEFDLWAELLVEDMKRNNVSLGEYDTVLIDEAQDMKEWAFNMLRMHMKPDATVCVAAGSGQELYGTSSQWLEEYSQRIETFKPKNLHSLRRNFRNTKPVFMLARTAYEAEMKETKIADAIKRFKVKNNTTGILPEFDREEGNFPRILNIDETSSLEDERADDWYHNRILSEYKRVIEQQIKSLSQSDQPIDLLLLVPNADGSEHQWATEALKELEIAYIDYTQEQNRRNIAPPEKVRFCTFHSSRGLEAQRVIIFGFEKMENLATKTNTEMKNIAYIILSRANFDCTIVVLRSVPTRTVAFVEKALSALHNLS